MGKNIRVTEEQFQNIIKPLMEQYTSGGVLEIPEEDNIENEYVPEKRDSKETVMRLLNAMRNDLNRVTSGNVAHVKMSLMGGIDYMLELVETDWKDCDESI